MLRFIDGTCLLLLSAILILGNFAPYQRSLVQVQGAKRSPGATVLLPAFP
jgi:hypothetical protein